MEGLTMVAGVGLLFLMMFWLSFFCIGILGTIFWIWMLVDCLTNEPNEGNDKVIWVLVIIFTHFIGALIYFFVRKNHRNNTTPTALP
jgi:hypothetical protein